MELFYAAQMAGLDSVPPVGVARGALGWLREFGNRWGQLLSSIAIALSVVRWAWLKLDSMKRRKSTSRAIIDICIGIVLTVVAAVTAYTFIRGTAQLWFMSVNLILLGAFLLSALQVFVLRAQRCSWAQLKELYCGDFRIMLKLRDNESVHADITRLLKELTNLPKFVQTAVAPIARSSVRNLLSEQTEELNVGEYVRMLESSMKYEGVSKVILFSVPKPSWWGIPPASVQRSLGMDHIGAVLAATAEQDTAWAYFRTQANLADTLKSEDFRIVRVMCISEQDWEADPCALAFMKAHAKTNIGLYRVNPRPGEPLPCDMGLFETKLGERWIVWSRSSDMNTKSCRAGVHYQNLQPYTQYLGIAQTTAVWLLTTEGKQAQPGDLLWEDGPGV